MRAIKVVIILLMLALAVGARDYSFPKLTIDLVMEPDGSLRVTEERTARFDGSYSGLYQWIRTQGQMRVVDVVVREGQTIYQRLNQRDPGPAGTFIVRESSDQVYIDWSFQAQDQTRTFTLEYRILGAVLAHQDVAEFYYQFVGDQWERGVGSIEVTLRLPPGARAEELRAWGHGPLHGQVQILDGEQIHWEVNSLPPRTMLEGRVTLPLSLVPQAPRTQQTALPGILQEEEAWAQEANRRRAMARWDWFLGILLAVGGIVGAISWWSKYGREYPPEFTGEYYRDLPGEYTPAELGHLWRMGQVNMQDLTATLIDLARRKHLKIEEYTEKGLLGRAKVDYRVTRLERETQLGSHETRLLQFLFNDVDEKKEGAITFKQLEKYSRRRPRTFAKFVEDWKYDVRAEADRHGFFDETVKGKQVLGIVLGMLIGLLAIPAFITGLLGTGIGLIIAGLALLISGACTSRRSQTGSTQYAQWKAFQRFLKHFSNMSKHEIPSLVIWEHYLVYAITLGVAKEVIKQLQLVYPNLNDGRHHFGYGWYIYGTGGLGNLDQSLTQMTTSIQNSFQTSLSAATSANSSGKGTGGGFSSGGGGGFGGGGGGAR